MLNIDGFGFAVLCCGVALIVGLLALLIAVVCIKDRRRILYLVESLMLIAVVILLAVGTRDTVLKVVDMAREDKVVMSANHNKAVLDAYRQLNDELNRWSVMFVVLGSFFGLVLPIGSYLLQMKEVSRKESEVGEKLKEEENERKEEIKNARMEMQELRRKFSEDVSKVWRSQAIMAYDRVVAVILAIENDNWMYDKGNRRELISALLLCLKYLENCKNQDFIVRKVADLSKLVREFNANVSEEAFTQWLNGWGRQSSDTKIALCEYCDSCTDALREIRDFVRKFGFTVLD